jgi:hypothetical protein
MPTLVFGKLTSSVVVAVDNSGVGSWVVKACEELAEEDDFVGSVVEGDVFGVARGICGQWMFVGRPGNSARTEWEAIAANRMTRDGAIIPIGVREARRADWTHSPEYQREKASAFEVPYNADCGIPVLGAVAVQDWGKAADTEWDVRPGSDSKIIQRSD